MGDYEIGKVHRRVPDDVADYLIKNKKFRQVGDDFDPRKPPKEQPSSEPEKLSADSAVAPAKKGAKE